MVAGIAITANKILRFQGANTRRAVPGRLLFAALKKELKPSSFQDNSAQGRSFGRTVVESLRIANGQRIDLCKERNIVSPHSERRKLIIPCERTHKCGYPGARNQDANVIRHDDTGR